MLIVRYRRRAHRIGRLGLLALLLAQPIAHAATIVYSWQTPTNGDWTAANWLRSDGLTQTPNAVLPLSGPAAGDLFTVQLAAGSIATPAVITLDSAPSIISNLVTAFGNTLSVTGNGVLNLRLGGGAGTVVNNGNLLFNGNGGTTGALAFSGQGSASFSGIGSVVLGSAMFGSRSDGLAFADIVNGAGHAIRGSGSVLAGTFINRGLLEAANGTLVLRGSFVNDGGTLRANNGTLQVGSASGSATITDATITTVAGTVTLANATLRNVTLGNGAFNVPNNVALNVQLGLVNNGTLSLNAANGFTSRIFAQYLPGDPQTPIVLSGSGAIVMGNNTGNDILGSFQNAAGHTIRGAGRLSGMNNAGRILAEGSSGLTVENMVRNSGTLEALAGAQMTLRLSGGAVLDNTGGFIRANGGVVVLNHGVNVAGGELAAQVNGRLTLTGNHLSAVALRAIAGGGINVATSATLLNSALASGTLYVDNNARLDLAGGYSSVGTITLNAANGFASTLGMSGAGTVTLNGTGTIAMSNNAGNNIVGTSTAGLWIGAGHLIRGSGGLGAGSMAITNLGTVRADQSTPLIVRASAAGFANSGIVEAASGGTLNLEGSFANTGGTIRSTGGIVNLNGAAVSGGNLTSTAGSGALVRLSAATVQAGSFVTRAGTVSDVLSNSTLGGGVTIDAGGELRVNNNVQLTLQSGVALANHGSLTLNAANGFTSILLATGGGTVTLGGSGSVALGNNTANFVRALSGTALVIGPNQVVQGAGQIGTSSGGPMRNDGQILATLSSGIRLTAGASTFTNNNLLAAAAGGRLEFVAGEFINNGVVQAGTGNVQIGGLGGATDPVIVGGTLSVAPGARMTLTGATVRNAQFVNTNGALDALGSTSLDDVALSGRLDVGNNATLRLGGTRFDSQGSVFLNAANGFVSDVRVVGNGVYAIGGDFVLGNNSGNRIWSDTATLSFATGTLLRGSGEIGRGLSGIVNDATIAATQSTPLNLRPSAAGFTNTGLLQSTPGGTLNLTGTYRNTGGAIQANGGLVNLDQASVLGGEVTANATGLVLRLMNSTVRADTFGVIAGAVAEIASSSTLGRSVGIASGGQLRVANNQTLMLEAGTTFTNHGTVTLNSASDFPSTLIATLNGTVELAGTGAILMSNNTGNVLRSGAATRLAIGATQTVRGAGTVGGSDSGPITNAGFIDASGSIGMRVIAGPGGFTNTGAMFASTGTLNIVSGSFLNSGSIRSATGAVQIGGLGGGTEPVIDGGLLGVNAGGSMTLTSPTVRGSTLTNSGGTLRINGVTRFENVVAFGRIDLQNNAVIQLSGTQLDNRGTITLNAANGFTSELRVLGTGTYTLGGEYVLSNNVGNRIFGDTATLAFATGSRVRGSGSIGMARTGLVSDGTVSADQSNALDVVPGASGMTNTGVLQAIGGGTLNLAGTYRNTGGEILANGGTVNMTNASVSGGSVSITGSGTTLRSLLSTLRADDLRIDENAILDVAGDTTVGRSLHVRPHGELRVGNAQTLTLESGGSYTFERAPGTVVFSSGGEIRLNAASGLTSTLRVQGGGTVSLSGSGNIYTTANAGNRILGDGATRLEIGPEFALSFAGQLGSGTLGIINRGRIADTGGGAPALTINPNALGFVNSGEIEANFPMVFGNGGAIDNTGGLIHGRGGLTFNASVIEGGVIRAGRLFTGSTSFSGSGGTVRLNDATLRNVQLEAVYDSFRQPFFTDAFELRGHTVLDNSRLRGYGFTSCVACKALVAVPETSVLEVRGGQLSLGGPDDQIVLSLSAGAQGNAHIRVTGGGTLLFTGSGEINSNNMSNTIASPDGTEILFAGNNRITGAVTIGNGTTAIRNEANIGGGVTHSNQRFLIRPGAQGFRNEAFGRVNAANGAQITIAGATYNAGLVQIENNSTLTLSAGSYQTSNRTLVRGSLAVALGDFVQTAGHTTVNGTLSARSVRIAAGSVLDGTGVVRARTSLFGRMKPGLSPGQLTIDGDLEMAPESELEIELGGTAPGEYDRLIVTGQATFAGILRLTLYNGFVPAPGDTFDIFGDAVDLTAFDTVILPSAPGVGLRGVIAPNGALVFEAFDATPPIPEPSTWALLIAGLALVTLATRGRRQR